MHLLWLEPALVVCLIRWGDLEFPLPFGRSMTAAEEYVHDLDSKTGASLKLSILNPKVSVGCTQHMLDRSSAPSVKCCPVHTALLVLFSNSRASSPA